MTLSLTSSSNLASMALAGRLEVKMPPRDGLSTGVVALIILREPDPRGSRGMYTWLT